MANIEKLVIIWEELILNHKMEKKKNSGMLFSDFFTTTKKESVSGSQRTFARASKYLKGNLKDPVEQSLKMYESGQNMIRRKIRSSDKKFFRTSN